MSKSFFLLVALFVLIFYWLSKTATAEVLGTSAEPGAFLPSFDESQAIQKLYSPSSRSFSISVLPKVLELRTSYLEKREKLGNFSGPLSEAPLRRHLNVLGTFSYFGDRMVGEGELAYSPLSSVATPCACSELPKMVRLGLKDHWAGFNYGLDYRSFDRGFVFVAGDKIDQPREEAQLWGERNLGLFKIRGSLGESWERLLDTNQLRLAKTATAAIKVNKPQWSARLVSSFSLTGQKADAAQETTVFTHTITGSYQPVRTLTIGPKFGIKEERNLNTGIRTETPAAGLTMTYAPWQDALRFTGGASYARSFSVNGLTDASTVDTTAVVEWKFGNSRAADKILSFNLHYNRRLDFIYAGNSHENVAATVQLKILGF